jgi:hypothetical protein
MSDVITRSVFLIVPQGQRPLDGWFLTARDAQRAIDVDDLEGDLGQCEVVEAKYLVTRPGEHRWIIRGLDTIKVEVRKFFRDSGGIDTDQGTFFANEIFNTEREALEALVDRLKRSAETHEEYARVATQKAAGIERQLQEMKAQDG